VHFRAHITGKYFRFAGSELNFGDTFSFLLKSFRFVFSDIINQNVLCFSKASDNTYSGTNYRIIGL